MQGGSGTRSCWRTIRGGSPKPPAYGIPLVLSGHTHGGQVVLPIVGAMAAQKFPVIAGLGRRGDTTMFVSRGLGTIYVPIRINARLKSRS